MNEANWSKLYPIVKTLLFPRPAQLFCAIVLLAAAVSNPAAGVEPASSIVYEGNLNSDGTPANGRFDFSFTLFDAPTAGNRIGIPVAIPGVRVTNGAFSVIIDFGIHLSRATALWFETAVAPAGFPPPVVVGGRVPLNAARFAVHSSYAANLVGNAFDVTLAGNTTNANAAPGTVAIYDANRVLTNSAVTADELMALAGVRRPLQVQIDAADIRSGGSVTNLRLSGDTILPGLRSNRLAIVNADGVLASSGITADEVSVLSNLRLLNVKAPPYSAVGDGVADDSMAIQWALSDAVAAGGRVVYLPPGVYRTTRSLVVGSNTRVIGAGRGLTVLRGPPGTLVPANVNGAGVYAVLAMVAADRSSIENLTVDNRSNGTDANGIAMLPDGPNYSGTPCTQCSVMNCEVYGYDTHQYLIWNLRGTTIRIINNYCDGGAQDQSSRIKLEGIETFGGQNVVIRDNTVLNVGINGINVASHPMLPQTGLKDIIVVNNCVRGAYNGIWCNTSVGAGITNNINGVQILGNVVERCASAGFYFVGADGTSVDALLVSGNVFRDTLHGVNFYDPWQTTFNCTSIEKNAVINSAQSASTIGVVIQGADGVNVVGNSFCMLGYGVWLVDAKKCFINQNHFSSIQACGVNLIRSAGLDVRGNHFNGFNLARKGWNGAVVVSGVQQSVITGNSFFSDFDTVAMRIDAASGRVLVRDNPIQYDSALAAPIVNNSTGQNTGVLRFSAGSTVLDITNAVVNGSTRLLVLQERGAPVAFTVRNIGGGFRVTLGRVAAGDESFRFEVLP